MNNKSIKTMVLGIIVILFGGFIMLDSSSDLKGIEFFILIIGLIIGIVGFFQKN